MPFGIAPIFYKGIPMDDVTKAEIDRLWDENTRQNHRIETVENDMKSLRDISLSVQKLALTMEQMVKEQAKQGSRLEALEKRPAEAWNTMTKTIFTTIVSAIAGGLAVMICNAISNGGV